MALKVEGVQLVSLEAWRANARVLVYIGSGDNLPAGLGRRSDPNSRLEMINLLIAFDYRKESVAGR
jgi:hypothetical protein